MKKYEYGVTRVPGRVIFGAGQRAALGRVAASFGKRALICTDSRLGQDSLIDQLVSNLAAHGVEAKVFDGTQAELPLEGVRECVAQYRQFDADIYIGVGGGSCIDLAKVVSLLMTYPEPVAQYYGEFKVPGSIRPVIAIPTTSGTGSEVTPVAVLADPQRAMKAGISSPELIPHVAICDPELTLSCPSGLTAITGTDALSHAIEAISAIRREPDPSMVMDRVFVGKNTLSDHYALQAIRLITDNLATAVEHGSDITARSAMMLASTYAGMAFSTAGTCAAHAIQYPVGALTHTSHGLGIGVLLPYTMDFNLQASVDVYAEIAEAMGISSAGGPREAACAMIASVRALLKRINVPSSLKDLGVKPEDLDAIAQQTMSAARLVENNPRKLDIPGVRSILDAAMQGA
ncbi:iron-containing alcohol dehydrogenase [Castellaniella sp.]|uniref:iron-containing alcohol dehydrogenase n=1 Tax=Castellaniella sp. TaxID=1955812 RepID=UPI003C7093B1